VQCMASHCAALGPARRVTTLAHARCVAGRTRELWSSCSLSPPRTWKAMVGWAAAASDSRCGATSSATQGRSCHTCRPSSTLQGQRSERPRSTRAWRACCHAPMLPRCGARSCAHARASPALRPALPPYSAERRVPTERQQVLLADMPPTRESRVNVCTWYATSTASAHLADGHGLQLVRPQAQAPDDLDYAVNAQAAAGRIRRRGLRLGRPLRDGAVGFEEVCMRNSVLKSHSQLVIAGAQAMSSAGKALRASQAQGHKRSVILPLCGRSPTEQGVAR